MIKCLKITNVIVGEYKKMFNPNECFANNILKYVASHKQKLSLHSADTLICPHEKP